VGQKNQIYCKWKRILFNPDNPNELFIVVEKDKPMSQETALSFDERFKGKDAKLIRKKKKEVARMLTCPILHMF